MTFPVLNRSWRQLSLALLLVPAAGMSVCTRDRGTQKITGPAAAVQTKTYQGLGVVKATDVKRPSIEIDHQEIKGLMPAMTMEFYVKDKSLLDGLKPGDQIEFTIEDGVGGIKITIIRKLSAATLKRPVDAPWIRADKKTEVQSALRFRSALVRG